MTPEEYTAAKAAAVAAAIAVAQQVAKLAAKVVLTPFEWLRLLQIVYPEVERRRTEVASLARDFYDSQRALHLPDTVSAQEVKASYSVIPATIDTRNDRNLEGSSFDVFVKDMTPVRDLMMKAETPNKAVTHFTMRVARQVELAGRNQIIKAMEEVDPLLDILIKEEQDTLFATEVQKQLAPTVSTVTDLTSYKESKQAPNRPALVKGWARVATGRETCAWCLMLISRGPVYSSTDNAGVHLDETTTIDLWNSAGQDLEEFRRSLDGSLSEWHAGCDCVAVPVFDRADWVGRDAYKQAEQLWISASLSATALIESGESRTNNKYKETLNYLRRGLSSGEIAVPSYAYAA